MAELTTQALPLLPLPAGVVLPQMVVTLALETDEAQAAAADGARRRPAGSCSCPASTGASPASGPSPGSRTRASCPTASGAGPARPAPGRARCRRHRQRRRPLGRGRAGRRGRPRPTARRSWPASCASVLTVLAERRSSRRLPELLRTVDRPRRASPTGSAGGRDLPVERKVELLETIDVEARVEKALDWAREALAELEVTEQIRSEVTDGMEKTAARVPAAPAARGHPQGAGRGRRRRDVGRGVPRAGSPRRELPETVARGGRARGRPARAHERAEPRARLDPHLARHDARAPVGHPLRRPARRHATPGASSTPTTPASTT